MIQRILHARHFVACLLAAATGMALYFRAPFPESNLFLQVMALRAHYAFLFFKYSYTVFLYTTPYITYALLLSGVYIFALKTDSKIQAGRLPSYSDPRKRTELSLVLGEVHHRRKQFPSETPQWLEIPERGLFTGIAIVGAVGSGKTAGCMYPFRGLKSASTSQLTSRLSMFGKRSVEQSWKTFSRPTPGEGKWISALPWRPCSRSSSGHVLRGFYFGIAEETSFHRRIS